MPQRLIQRVLVPAGFIFLWSSAYIVVRMGLPDMSPIASLALRFAVATVVLVALAQTMGQPLTVLGKRWPHFAVAGALMNGIYLATAYVALQYLAAGTMGLLASLNPMLTALLGWVILGERMRPSQWLGLGLGVAGVVPTGAHGVERDRHHHTFVPAQRLPLLVRDRVPQLRGAVVAAGGDGPAPGPFSLLPPPQPREPPCLPPLRPADRARRL